MQNWSKKWIDVLSAYNTEHEYIFQLNEEATEVTLEHNLMLSGVKRAFFKPLIPAVLKVVFMEEIETLEVSIHAEGMDVDQHMLEHELYIPIDKTGGVWFCTDDGETFGMSLSAKEIEEEGLPFLEAQFKLLADTADSYFFQKEYRERTKAYEEQVELAKVTPLHGKEAELLERLHLSVVEDVQKALYDFAEAVKKKEVDPDNLFASYNGGLILDSDMVSAKEVCDRLNNVMFRPWLYGFDGFCGIGKYNRGVTAGRTLFYLYFAMSGNLLYDYERYCQPLDVWEDEELEKVLRSIH